MYKQNNGPKITTQQQRQHGPTVENMCGDRMCVPIAALQKRPNHNEKKKYTFKKNKQTNNKKATQLKTPVAAPQPQYHPILKRM